MKNVCIATYTYVNFAVYYDQGISDLESIEA